MGKILIFIDAENVSKEQVTNALHDARSLSGKEDTLIGKFYGCSNVLGEIINEYLALGLEFVETSVYSLRKKNITDMKLMVDCLFDVVEAYRGDIKAIYILSNDYDYNPLVYKLKGFGFIVKAATIDSFGDISSAGDLAKFLTNQGFFPVNKNNVLCVLYEEIVRIAEPILLDDKVVLIFLFKRIRNLYSAINKNFNLNLEPESTDEFIKKFSFPLFWDMVQPYDLQIDEVFVLYQSRIFGSKLNKNDTCTILKKVRGD